MEKSMIFLGFRVNKLQIVVIFEKKILILHKFRKKKKKNKNMTASYESKQPQECTNITEVRNEIDNIDSKIIKLLSTRFDYVREVVKYKDNTAAGIEASDRRAAVITSRRKWAEEAGIDPDVIENIYNTLIEYFIAEEKKIMNN